MTTLARLSFWIPPDGESAFGSTFRTQIQPLLKKHGLTHPLSHSPDDRPAIDGVTHHFFEVESPARVAALEGALIHEPEWPSDVLLGKTGKEDPHLPRYYFGIYSTPARPGHFVDAGSGTRRKDWHTFSLDDGLPSPTIQALLQDRQGMIWVGTRDGLCRYDGARFECFTRADGLAYDSIISLLEDSQGRLWVGTGHSGHRNGKGGCCWDGSTWQTFTQADGLASNFVRALLEDHQGHLWLATERGVSRYDGQCFSSYTEPDGIPYRGVNSLMEDRYGQMWFGTEAGAICFDGERFTTYTTEHGLEDTRIHCFYLDRDGELWVTTSFGWSHFHPESQRFTTRVHVADRAYAMVVDGEGRWWFATTTHGIVRYDGQAFSYLSTADGLPGMGSVTMIRDREDRIWIGTLGAGLTYTDLHGCVTWTTEEGLADNAVSIVWEDRQGRLWVGTYPAVSCYDGAQFIHHQVDETKDVWNHTAYAFYEDAQGILWMASYKGGLFRYDGQTWEELLVGPYRFGENYARSLVEDPEGSLWFSTGGAGVYRYDGQELQCFTSADGLVEDEVCCILRDRQDQLWLATEGGGLSRYDGQQFVTVSEGAELGYHPPLDLLEDRHGHLWIATNGGGVYRYDGETFQRFTSQDGLAYNHVMCLCEDQRGHLWIGTLGGGVSRYDGRVFQRLSSADGLHSDSITSILEDRHGDIWISTRDGLTRYRSRSTPPEVRLREVQADRRYTPEEAIAVPESQPGVRFAFQGRSFTTRPEGMVYVYRLEGYDREEQVTREETVTYRALPQGAYTFRVQAVDRDLNYSEPAVVPVQVTGDPRIEGLQAALKQSSVGGDFVGQSKALRQVQQQLAQVAQAEVTVLILGETGTGKGLAARTVHEQSPRKAGPFLQINCGAITEGLVESELFGHEKGSFTGAHARQLGKVELAAGGTLFLDEIGDMSLEVQVKLLRLLEERTFERVGGAETLEAAVRVIAATNRDLEQMVQAGTFREDLFYRLHLFPVRLPPLRERREDIPALVDHFMTPMAAHLHKEVNGVTSAALALLKDFAWPGNVRELKNVMERAVIVCRGEQIQAADLTLGKEKPEGDAGTVPLTLEENERQHIQQVLAETGWVVRGAAVLLGIPESTLRFRIKKLGIEKP